MIGVRAYETKKKRLLRDLASQGRGEPLALDKRTTNLFRGRKQGSVQRLNVRDFDQVVSIDTTKKLAQVEGMATYETIVTETLKRGYLPAVVPQLKTITLGGAVSGLGIESSSWKYGFPHETVSEVEILTANGEVVVASATNEHQDLFFGLPNSYGTLGYALKLTVKLVPVKPFVQLRYLKFDNAKDFVRAMEQVCTNGKHSGKKIDFIDGVMFGPKQYVACLGTMKAKAAFVSDYTYKNIFYRSLQQKSEDYLLIHDYIWRWDTDWFWCSAGVGAQNSIIRRIYGKKRLRSDFYMKLYKFESKHRLMQRCRKLLKRPDLEEVIQDVEVPIANCTKFIDFYFRVINIRPVWVCPCRQLDPKKVWSLYPMNPNKLYLNFGFWSNVAARKSDPAFTNKKLEAELIKLRGKKSLYSSAYYDKTTFNKLYNGREYAILKSKYDPAGRLKDLYQKTVIKG